jgi:hypothetical protein
MSLENFAGCAVISLMTGVVLDKNLYPYLSAFEGDSLFLLKE